MSRRPAITIRWSKREQDWVIKWPAWHRVLRNTTNYLMWVLTIEPHPRANRPLADIEMPGALLHKDTIAELERRGIDTKAITIRLPLKPEPAAE